MLKISSINFDKIVLNKNIRTKNFEYYIRIFIKKETQRNNAAFANKISKYNGKLDL